MQTEGTLVGAGADWCRLPLPPSLERRARAQRAALVPGRLEEQAPGVRVAGLRDRALAAALTRGVLARDEPQEGAETLRSEALPLAELDAQGECGQGGDSAQTAKPAADLAEGRLAGELDDRLIERVPAPLRLGDGALALLAGEREHAACAALAAKPGVVAARPGPPLDPSPGPGRDLAD